MKTPAEWAKGCWHPLELGPGWEKRLTANIETTIRAAIAAAVAEEREACANVARRWGYNLEHLSTESMAAFGIAREIDARASGGNGKENDDD